MTQKPLSELSDEELVKHCLADDRRAQEALYRRYAKEMYRVALIYVESDADACDILQEGFLKFFRKLNRFRFGSAPKTWLRSIIVNTAITHYNKTKKDKERLTPLVHDNYKSEDNFLSQFGLSSAQIVKLINQLPAKAKMVIKLYAIEGYGHKEIATSMGISEGTSKSQLNRARTLLKQTIEKLHG